MITWNNRNSSCFRHLYWKQTASHAKHLHPCCWRIREELSWSLWEQNTGVWINSQEHFTSQSSLSTLYPLIRSNCGEIQELSPASVLTANPALTLIRSRHPWYTAGQILVEWVTDFKATTALKDKNSSCSCQNIEGSKSYLLSSYFQNGNYQRMLVYPFPPTIWQGSNTSGDIERPLLSKAWDILGLHS